jgi:hypothetical protein
MINEIWPIPMAYAIALAWIVFWHHVMKRLEAGEGDPDQPLVPYSMPFKEEPVLHRALTWFCGFLFAGLIVQGTFTLIVILTRYGVQQP